MKKDVVAKDCWIMGQLAGIRMLERELTDAFKKPRSRSGEGLQRRVAQLSSWVGLVDDALTVRARSGRTPRRISDRIVALPVYDSGSRLPAA
jgi:hypothetical protein